MSDHIFEDFLYIRGFLVSNKKEQLLLNREWEILKKDNIYLHFHPKTTFSYYEDNDNWVSIVGHCIDTINSTIDLKTISKYLYSNLLKSEEQFYLYLEKLTGRYALIVFYEGQLKIYNDATGMQSVFYHQKLPVSGSHAGLVAEVTDSKDSNKINLSWLSDPKTYHLPGHFTPYENVVYLLPNHYRNISKSTTVRYFPREEIVEKDVSEVSNIVIEEANKQLELLSKENKLLLSLTGGIDSRSTLSLMKDYVKSLRLFTYYYTHSKDSSYKGNWSLNIDRDLVTNIVNNIDLNHSFIPIDYAYRDELEHQALKNVLKRNTFLNHNSLLAKLYLDNFGEENYLHIRSNIQGITKGNYRTQYKFENGKASFDEIVTCTNPKLLQDEKALNLFEEWLQEYNPNVGFNFDPFDILLWESRMGTWHSQLLIQSDVAFNSHTLINSHYILKNLLSIPFELRQKKAVYFDIIEKKWPVLNFWQINKKENVYQLLKKQVKKFDEYNTGIEDFSIKYFSGNKITNNVVPHKVVKEGKTETFYIEKRAPVKGDYVEAVIPIEVEKINKDYVISLELCSPYHRPENAGRLKYQVFLNNNLFLEEDVSLWGKTNHILLPLNPKKQKNNIKVKIIAMRDCENWGWGKVSRVTIKDISIIEGKNNINNIKCSSPFSVITKKESKNIIKRIFK